MTGGRVVVLGPTGKNFAAGMSGGIAYVYDEDCTFPKNCNLEMVKVYPLEEPEDVAEVKALLQKFYEYTGSDRPWRMLSRWEEFQPKFVKVYPNDYRRVIEAQKRFKAQGLPEEEAVMAAFEANARDEARAGGK